MTDTLKQKKTKKERKKRRWSFLLVNPHILKAFIPKKPITLKWKIIGPLFFPMRCISSCPKFILIGLKINLKDRLIGNNYFYVEK